MYIIAATVQNKPGVLAKTSNLLRRKLFNIESLTAGTTHIEGVSKLIIVINGSKEEAQKAQRMISKLIEVLEVKILKETDFTVREIVLARLCVKSDEEYEKLKKAENGVYVRELHREDNQILVEIVDTGQAIDRFLDTLLREEVSILDWTRSELLPCNSFFS